MKLCNNPSTLKFIPQKHLTIFDSEFKIPKIRTLSDLGYNYETILNRFNKIPVCNFGCTDAFRLLTKEGVKLLRNDLIKQEILTNCLYSSSIAPLIMRGTSKYSTIMDDFCKSAEIAEFITNHITQFPVKQHPMYLENDVVNLQYTNNNENNDHDQKPLVFGWHLDSQPFTLIIKITDTNDGGTCIELGDGTVEELKYLDAGYAIFVQASVLPHCASPGNYYSRATLAQSWMPNDIQFVDDSNIALASQYTKHDELFECFIKFRMNDIIDKSINVRNDVENIVDNNNNNNIIDYESIILKLNNLTKCVENAKISTKILQKFEQPLPEPISNPSEEMITKLVEMFGN